jgi:Phosphomethylpyrimidine kinase
VSSGSSLGSNFQIQYRADSCLELIRGLEADQKVIGAHGCYAMTATTALTAQNTLGVVDIHYIPPDFVRKLIDAVRSRSKLNCSSSKAWVLGYDYLFMLCL